MRRTKRPGYVDGFNMLLTLNSGLLKAPRQNEPELYASTRDVARMLGVTPQRVGQYVNDEHLLKAERDRFYLPDVFNWQKAKLIADAMQTPLRELDLYGFVDFTLGNENMELNAEVLKRMTKKKKR